MRKEHLVAWVQFEAMMRTGVPHAMDIAAELVRYNLQVPLPTGFPKPEIDLLFYRVVHRAYRAGVLSVFLEVMEHLKASDIWLDVRDCPQVQSDIVQLCENMRRLPRQDLTALVSTRIASGEALVKGAA